MSRLPSGFDSWKTRESDLTEGPEGQDIMDNYSCIDCGGEFTEYDVNNQNYKMDYDADINGWCITHKDCERGLDQ